MVHSHDFYTLYQRTFDKYRDLYGEQVCVFLQKGSFYEIYGQEDPTTHKQLNTGKQILECMDIVIHVYEKDGPNDTTGYYGGVPVYVLDKWAAKLTTSGWTVVVIDEVKNGAGKVTSREVSKVLSAGTHLEAARAGTLHCLSALWMEASESAPPVFGVATADLTTGQVCLYEGRATGKSDCWHTDDLRHFFQVYPPKELLYCYKGGLVIQEEDVLRRTFHIPTAPIHSQVVQTQGAFDNPVTRADYLQQLFQPVTALPLRTWLRCADDGSSLSERALCTLLRFAEDHTPHLAKQLQAPVIWHPTHTLQIINNALTQLNLISTSPDQPSVSDLMIAPQTAMGKRHLLTRLCSPLADPVQICQRQRMVEWIMNASKQTQEEIHACLSDIHDVSRLHRTIVRGTTTAADVCLLYRSYMSARFLWKALQESPLATDSSIGTQITECLTVLETLFDCQKAKIAAERPDEISYLSFSIAPNCTMVEQRIQSVYTKAEDWLQSLRSLVQLDTKALGFKPTEKTMFVVYASKTALKQVETSVKRLRPEEQGTYAKLQYKSLTSSARIEHHDLDMFQEELDKLKGIFVRTLEQERPPICIQYAVKTRHYWQSLEEWITNVDVCLTMAKTSKAHGWVKPTIIDRSDTDASYVQIEHLRHPLIEVQKRQSRLVTHTISIGGREDGAGWLLYGMNASGKSSLMKAIGLAVLLAQVGCFVPATGMTIRPFRRLATRILNQDNLWAGLSSFAVEMSEVRDIVAVADHQTLVLGDELCAGTESISGTAIVAAGIQHLSNAGARFVLATHLHDLMKLSVIQRLPTLRVWHLHVEYDPVKDCLVYHRSLRPGSGSSQYGLEVAKALHLPHDMIESAFELRRELLGETSIESAPVSRWNQSLTRRQCSVCKTLIVGDLEVHHIQHRANAVNGRNADGTSVHHLRNLAVLCQVCHDKEHAEQIHVGEVLDTTTGPQREVINFEEYAYQPTNTTTADPITKGSKTKASRFTEDELLLIKETRQRFTALEPRLLRFQIRADHGIEVQEAELKRLIKQGRV